MSDDKRDPLENPVLKSLVQKATWIARMFGYWRWSPVPLPFRSGIYSKELRTNFVFQWENVRINAFQTVPVPRSHDSDLLQDGDPNLIISLRREKEARLFGIVLFRYHFFQELYVSDLSGMERRLKIPEGADLLELGFAIDELHDILQKLRTRSGLSVEQIKRLPESALKKLMKNYSASRP